MRFCTLGMGRRWWGEVDGQRELSSILKRLNLESLGDVKSYRRRFEETGFVDLTGDMEVRYVRILGELEGRERELRGVGNVKIGLRN